MSKPTATPARATALSIAILTMLSGAPPAGAADWGSQARALAASMVDGDRTTEPARKDNLPAMQFRSLGVTSVDADAVRISATGGTWSLAADSTSRETTVRNQATGSTLLGERYLEVSYAPGGRLTGASLTTGYRSAASAGFGVPAYRAWYGRAEHSYAVSRRTQAGVAFDVEQTAVRGVAGYAGATLFVSHDLRPDVTAGAYVGRTRAFDGYASGTAGLSISIGF
jgi:hypothetical protein